MAGARSAAVARTLGTLGAVRAALKAGGSAVRARSAAGFFKTEPGQYAAGDRFRGIRVPRLRALAARSAGLSLGAVERLLSSAYHEDRLLALLLMVRHYERGAAPVQRRVMALYLRRLDRVNNWDLVDSSAPPLLGVHLANRSRAILWRLAASPDLWRRRVAVLATFSFIRRGEYAPTLLLAKRLLNDPEDLIHKAIGWMLRELGKRSPVQAQRFLRRHAARMPRTMLRYAIEKLSAAQRAGYMRMRSTRRATRGRRHLR